MLMEGTKCKIKKTMFQAVIFLKFRDENVVARIRMYDLDFSTVANTMSCDRKLSNLFVLAAHRFPSTTCQRKRRQSRSCFNFFFIFFILVSKTQTY